LTPAFAGVASSTRRNVLPVESGSGVIDAEAIMSKNVGVIGLGAMGYGVASSLLRAGFNVHACDVRKEVLDKFAAAG
ncbi:NAD(P)-binding domain-containing protein, partial [Salmonella enterica]|uniref:NAD(P)-binding domain-containing protein n=1 Tax=Salmonella enterica TaxID=28901 RepID=UPI003CF5C977